MKTFSFLEAAPLLKFIKEYGGRIAGKPIKAFYTDICFGELTPEPVAFEFEDIVLVVDYYYYSNMTIHVVEPEQFHGDPTLNFLYRDIPECRNLRHYISEDEEFPYLGCKVAGISVECFSEEFEINTSKGTTRPEGGDYFRMITVLLEDGREFYLSALPATCDGYMEVWD